MFYIFKHISNLFLFIGVYDRAISETEGEVGCPFNRLSPLLLCSITVRSKAALLIWLSDFACFGVSFCTVFTFNVCI